MYLNNHPSGTLTVSTEDIEFTKNIVKACEQLGLELHDHIIVTDKGFASMKERGLI